MGGTSRGLALHACNQNKAKIPPPVLLTPTQFGSHHLVGQRHQVPYQDRSFRPALPGLHARTKRMCGFAIA
jgi:hypothetical protein